jgi:hypothetical protein
MRLSRLVTLLRACSVPASLPPLTSRVVQVSPPEPEDALSRYHERRR